MNHGSGAGKRVKLCYGSLSIPLEGGVLLVNAAQPEWRYEQKPAACIKTYRTITTNKVPGKSPSVTCCPRLSPLPEAENKIWHAHPVWFLNGNPIVGYSKLKGCIRLLFWSGQSFEEPGLSNEGKFKAAEVRYISIEQVNTKDLKRWLKKARTIQWDYKNIVKRKGQLERLK
mgnify:CR=1 FL=1